MRKSIKLVFLLPTVLFFNSCSVKEIKKQNLSQLKTDKLIHLWAVNVLKDNEFGSPRHEFLSPVLIGNELIIGSSDGALEILDKNTGSLKRRITGSGGIEASPLYNKGTLCWGNNQGEIKAYSYRMGKYLWSYYTGFPIHSSPIICNGIMTILSSNDVVYALDPETGKVLWSQKRSFPAKRPVIRGSSTPVCYNNNVYVGFSDGYLSAFNIYDGTIKFEKNISSEGKFKDVDASPYIKDDTIIIASYDGSIFSLNANTGVTNWSVNDGSANSIVLDSDVIYYASNEGYLYSIDFKDGNIKWKIKLKNKAGVPSKPAIMNDYLVVGTSNRGLQVYSKNDGTFITEYNSGMGVLSQPIVYDDNTITFFSNGAVVHSFLFGRF